MDDFFIRLYIAFWSRALIAVVDQKAMSVGQSQALSRAVHRDFPWREFFACVQKAGAYLGDPIVIEQSGTVKRLNDALRGAKGP
ncbi:MAG TPA: hypothetical protein VIX91_26245 [Candidatus Acidoferrum sp.]